jgi:hypothetical protein
MPKIIKLVGITALLVLTLAITFLCIEVYAQDYIAPEQGPVVANISDKGVNRIAIGNDRITQVIGNEDEYIIESDANLGQIFLTPILKSPQEISLRLVTEREKIIDVKFKIKKIEPQTINLKYKDSSNPTNSNLGNHLIAGSNIINNNFSITQMSGNTETQQIIDNLKLAYSNKLHGIKLPTLSCFNKNSKLKSLKLIEATQYSVNKQIIVKAVVSNTNKTEISLNESDFVNCMSTVKAVSLESNRLTKGLDITIYMVGQDGK